MEINIASLADIHEILALIKDQFHEHNILWDERELHLAVSGILTDERWGHFMLARQDGQVVGLAAIAYAWTLEHGGKSAWLDELYVVPRWRSRGIGGALLEGVIAFVQRQGCLALDLEVDEDHQRAEHLYQRKGFVPLSRRRWVKSLGLTI